MQFFVVVYFSVIQDIYLITPFIFALLFFTQSHALVRGWRDGGECLFPRSQPCFVHEYFMVLFLAGLFIVLYFKAFLTFESLDAIYLFKYVDEIL